MECGSPINQHANQIYTLRHTKYVLHHSKPRMISVQRDPTPPKKNKSKNPSQITRGQKMFLTDNFQFASYLIKSYQLGFKNIVWWRCWIEEDIARTLFMIDAWPFFMSFVPLTSTNIFLKYEAKWGWSDFTHHRLTQKYRLYCT